MGIVCKFRCQSVKKFTDAERVKFTAVPGKENEPQSKLASADWLELTLTNRNALGWFEPGKDYVIDVHLAE